MNHDLSASPEHSARLEKLFSKIRHFSDLPRETLVHLASIAHPAHFDAGQVIFIEGEPARQLYLLERGWVKATRMSLDGREQAMIFLQTGEIFGDIAVFSDSAYPGTVAALEDVDVWVIPAEAFMKQVRQDIGLAMAIIHRLSERVQHYIGMVEDLSLRDVEARLANTLLQHAEKHAGQLIIPRRHWTTFDEMAIRLGTVRDVLSRALKKLETEGLLRVEKHQIVLLDPQELAGRGKL
ncbi:MAG: Crp/Fnr family transcriptional regulator [Anaerolineales bacterium]|nr:Crp/Fnr family transcriptional regulator [Anaerolineales bacterium]